MVTIGSQPWPGFQRGCSRRHIHRPGATSRISTGRWRSRFASYPRMGHTSSGVMLPPKALLAGTPRASSGSLLSVEFPLRSGLIWAHPTDCDLGREVILAFDRDACQTPHHRNLSDVRECVSNRSLEKLLSRSPQGQVRPKIVVECRQRIMEAAYIVAPGARLGIMPLGFPLRNRQHPIEKIAKVREDGTCGLASAATG